tara:strand:- start:404 stop:760 length:357 start_codon:yes stop_codon:yes gene_type:complete
MLIFKKYFFDAAHYLSDIGDNQDYKKMHGHSYEVVITLSGKVNHDNNWVMDLEELDKLVKPEISLLDHSTLNNVVGLENPTSENIAKWLWIKIKEKAPNLQSVEVNRPRIGGCIYSGE